MQRTREDCEVFFTQVAHAANELNANYYTFHGPAKLKKRKYIHNYEWIAKCLAHLNNILSSCTNGKCELAYENVHWTYFDEPEFFKELKTLSPVKACLDIKQAQQSGIDVYDYIDVMKDRIVNVHVCDYDDDGRLKLPGQGTFNFVKLCKALININYKGPLIIEVYANNYNSFSEIQDSMQYLLECINTAEQM
jgi:sugar phosphate isomerase/epimerase